MKTGVEMENWYCEYINVYVERTDRAEMKEVLISTLAMPGYQDLRATASQMFTRDYGKCS
jgi:wyosine [tRNA(Phe)-imidazoG37] synthetase (radical SAM superfamily)